MSFFISIIFGNIMEVVTPNNDSPLHFGGDANSLEDLAPDGDSGCEWTFSIDVLGFNGFLRGPEPKSNILIEPDSRAGLLGQQLFAVQEHVLLFLK